jgi:hypothetical protein
MPKKILQEAIDLIDVRGQDYGGIEKNFERAAAISSLKLNVNITPYMVAIILESVKDARRAVNPMHYDSHLDGLNYRAFAWMLLQNQSKGEM